MTSQQQSVIDSTAEHMRATFGGEGTGHDWWHMYRVWRLAQTIAAGEAGVDHYVVELGALLHDIADWKFHDGDETVGPRAAREWLTSLDVEETIILHIEDIIRTVSFKGAHVPSDMKTVEGQIVHDADKLDALGAIGIARAFAYGGAHDRGLYDPHEKPELHVDFETYKQNKGSTISHFHEKLLLLKDRMYTQTAKDLAAERHAYLETFLDEFHAEWNGAR